MPSTGDRHRLTKPRTPKTNGMVERFHGRLRQVLRSHHFNSAEDLEKTLHRFVWLYHHHLPQKALGHEAPDQALKKWKMKAPDLFVKNVRNHPGPDKYRLGLVLRCSKQALSYNANLHTPFVY